MVSQVSILGLREMTSNQLLTEKSTLEKLNEQLSSGVQNDDLTDYDPTVALNLVNLQNSITQRQSFTSSMTTVQSRLSLYDSTMTDLESVATTAQQLASQNTSYNASTISELQSQISSYMKQTGDDLNQEIGGRYIYAGSRYSTAPVSNITQDTSTVSYPFTATTAPALASYDVDYAGGLTTNVSGQNVTISGTANTPQNVSVEVNNKQYTYAVQSGDTANDIAAGLATLVSADIPNTTSSNGVLTVGGSGTINNAASDSSTSAYTLDSVTADVGYSVSYGVSSNDPAFQKLVAGLKLMNQATQTTDPTTYSADMQNASTLLNDALTSIQGLHTTVASNINLMAQEQSTQSTDITNLENQITDLSSVDTTTVSTEITTLQAQLDASYSATGSILKLSLVNYL